MLFEYIAAEKNGKIRTSQIEAVDKTTAISCLKDKDLLVIKVSEKQKDLKSKFLGKVDTLDKINLTGNLSVMLKAGVGVSEALEIIGRDSKNLYFQNICTDLRFSMENGSTLSAALASFSEDFDKVFISLIKAGEASGKLEKVLSQLSLQLKRDHSLNSKIRSAFAYPIVLICGLLAVVILIMTFVLPKLVALFQSSNLPLPLGTRIIFSLSQVLSQSPIATIVVIILLAIGIFFLSRNKKTKDFFYQLLSHLPVTNKLLQEIELTRFTETLANLMQSGLPIIQSLEITAEAMRLPSFRKIILSAKEEIAKGVPLSKAFDKDKTIFPSMLISVMQVGEKSGNIDELLFGLNVYFSEQVENTLAVLASLVEPVLLVIVGLAVGSLAISIILPIYQLIGSF